MSIYILGTAMYAYALDPAAPGPGGYAMARARRFVYWLLWLCLCGMAMAVTMCHAHKCQCIIAQQSAHQHTDYSHSHRVGQIVNLSVITAPLHCNLVSIDFMSIMTQNLLSKTNEPPKCISSLIISWKHVAYVEPSAIFSTWSLTNETLQYMLP